MSDNYNYPVGSDTPDAPWNRIDPPELEFNCSATVVLNKTSPILTERVYCDDGDWRLCDDVSMRDVWKDNFADITVLLSELVKYIDQELANNPSYVRKWELVRMKASARGWTSINEEYEEY